MARSETTSQSNEASAPDVGRTRGRWLLVIVAALVVAVMLPVVVKGALLADEYIICLRPVHDGGYGPYLEAIWHDTGVVRPARFVELFLIAETCRSIPYGFVIAIPLLLKLAAAATLLGLLRDLRIRAPWPEIGAAIWLLEPLGTEAALWPASLHVLLGCFFALSSLRCFRRGLVGWGSLLALGASLSLEQAIFALPLAIWLITPREHRRRALVAGLAVALLVLIAYSTWPGNNPRQALTLVERLDAAVTKRGWYVFFPAVGLGLHSGALAIVWAFPLSLLAIAGGTFAGARGIPWLLVDHPSETDPRISLRGLATVTALILLVNLPLIVTEVGYSARTFTPTWLVLAASAGIAGSRVRWRRPRLLGAFAGASVAIALLSLALSVSVRVRTADLDRAAARWIADRTRDGDVVAVCDVGRTAVEPAPLGAFHLHPLHSTSGDWIEYSSGRVVEVRRSGERYWGARCPDLAGADLIVRFPALVQEFVGPAPDTP